MDAGHSRKRCAHAVLRDDKNLRKRPRRRRIRRQECRQQGGQDRTIQQHCAHAVVSDIFGESGF
jgi:hypothetical protein